MGLFKRKKKNEDGDTDVRLVYKCDEIADITEVVIGSIFRVTVSEDIPDVLILLDKKWKNNLVSKFEEKDKKTHKTAKLHVTLNGPITSTGRELAKVILPKSKLNLDRVELGGSAYMAGGHFNALACAVVTSGASELVANITSKRILINTSGSSSVVADGECDTIAIDSSGSSEVAVLPMKVKSAVVTSTGASSVHVNPTGCATVRASGASNVEFNRYVILEDVKTSGAASCKRVVL